jgi:hypothetical protein
MKNLFTWLGDRAVEPSTLSAITALSVLAGIKIDPGIIQNILTVVAVLTGAAAAVKKG